MLDEIDSSGNMKATSQRSPYLSYHFKINFGLQEIFWQNLNLQIHMICPKYTQMTQVYLEKNVWL